MTTSEDNFQIPTWDLVQAVLRRGETGSWCDWIPLSVAAAQTPENWIESFLRLRLEHQFDLLNLLADSAAGPLADALLLLLAAHANRFGDDQVRQNTLDYASAAYERRILQLDWLRDQLQTLTTGLEHARQRMQEGFDVALEITRLHKELTEIQSKDNLEDRFSEIHAMESEILRLETFQKSLSRYEKDRPQREAYLADLKQETEKLRMQKEQLEHTVAAALADVNSLRAETDHQEKTRLNAEAEMEKLARLKTDLDQSLMALKKENIALKAMNSEQERERQHILEEVETLKKEVADRNALLQSEKKNLEELRIEAERSNDCNIMERVDELYRLLPADRTDAAMNIGGRN